MKFDTYLVFDIILTALGICLVVSALLMKKTCRIPSLLLDEPEQKKLRDQKGYVVYMWPRLLAFAAVCTLIGVFGILDDLKLLVIPYWGFAEMTLFLVVFLIFYTWLRAARNKFM